MWAAILLVVVFRLVRRDGIECLVGVLEWLLGLCELFLFIAVDLMLSSAYDVRVDMLAESGQAANGHERRSRADGRSVSINS